MELARAWMAFDYRNVVTRLQTTLADDEFCAKVLAITQLLEVEVLEEGAVDRLLLPSGAKNSRAVFYGFGQAVYSGQSLHGAVTYDADWNDGSSGVRFSRERVLVADNGRLRYRVDRTAVGCVLRNPPAREEVMPVDDTPAGPSGVADVIRDVLDVMFKMFPTDEVIARIAKGFNFTLMFTLPDVDLSFHLKFENDQIAAYFVDAQAEANVKFHMDSDVLDGIFTQRLNVMGAAFSGQIVFQGDVEKAILLQGFLGDFARLYKLACAQFNVATTTAGEAPQSGAVMRAVETYAPAVLGWVFAHKKHLLAVLIVLLAILVARLIM